ncbi:MAG TPA: hypothetical protein VGV08_07955 [Casimicrobiaceae bacterium]|nr:hypothetical protein [Casimicrobiaceae bacterium]
MATASAQNLVLNPSFESVELGLAGGLFSNSVPTNWNQGGTISCGYEALTAGQTPINGADFTIGASGAAQAYLPTDGTHVLISDEGFPHVFCQIYQDVAIPASATAATLTLAAGSVFQFNRFNDSTVNVAVTTPGGVPIASIYTRSSAAGSNDPLVDRAPVDLIAYAGQTVRIVGTTTVGGGDWSGLQMDNVRLIVQAKPDLNQHGLTGSWYEPATSGQGIEVEVYPDLSPGMGVTFVSWFTYDAVSGGADHQRWYTAEGPVATGQPNATLAIYQNTGGNFNAPPITNSQVVGTATLSFDSCSSGNLAYNFTDGTGRAGNIPLTRITQNVTCSITTPYPTNADFALSGNWYEAATSGQGFTIEVNPDSGAFFLAWYTYLPNGTMAGAAGQRWYTAEGSFTPGMRSIPVTIYETTGGMFDRPTPPGQSTVPVGAGTMTFQSCSAATFNYNFSGGTNVGLSGTISLSRVGPTPPGCTS